MRVVSKRCALQHALRGAFLALLALSACSSGSGDPLTRSCGGDAIGSSKADDEKPTDPSVP